MSEFIDALGEFLAILSLWIAMLAVVVCVVVMQFQ